jgi:MFS family permease
MTDKLNYRKTFILGFGFFAISLVWPLYNFYVPLFLSDYIGSQFWINAVMTIDNIMAVTLIPLFGNLSDRTKTRFGRRMPFLIFGIPISAFLFTLLPNYSSFLSLMIILITLNLAMAVFRAPTIALMPDITPKDQRSKANGIINFMGGLASVLVLSVGAILFDINKILPFISTAILMIFSLFLLVKFIKEPETVENEEKHEKVKLFHTIKEIFQEKDTTARNILFAIFFWFVGYNGIEATFSRYSVEFLKIKASTGSLILSTFAASFLIFAIPSGFIATKIGKKRTIKIGIIGLIITFGLLAFVRNDTVFLSLNFSTIMIILMALGGFFWACININSYPMVVEKAEEKKVGTFTGIYYFFSMLAAILGPLFFGLFVDLIGFETMFVVASVSFVFALISIVTIRDKNR